MILNKQTILLQNIRSPQKNFDLLNIHLETLKSKLIALCLTETWLKNHYKTSQFLLKEYQKLCSCERKKRVHGAGIFVVNNLDFVEEKRCDHNDLQAITIKIKAGKQLYLMITWIYIPSRKQNIVKFQRLEKYLDTLPIQTTLRQAYTMRRLQHYFLINSTNFRKTVTLLAGNNLSLVENIKPTQETSSTKSTLCLAFCFKHFVFCPHSTDSGISDHHTVTLTFEQSRENSSNSHEIFTRKWAKLENRKFVEDLNNILMDKLKVITCKGSEWSPEKAFEKLH